MTSGVVKIFLRTQKYGFIVPDDGGDDVMVGDRALSAAGLTELQVGDRVTFLSERNDKGERVAKILSVESASPRSTPSRRRYYDLSAA